jgi:hypothetical protein
MRVAALFVLIAPACGTSPPQDACGTSAPLLAACVAHGLASIDLSGAWTFTGMETTYSRQPPADPVTMPATFEYTFAIDGCHWNWTNVSDTTNHVDDTNAADDDYAIGDEHGPATICAAADGTVQLSWNLGYERNGYQGAVEDVGTLTR